MSIYKRYVDFVKNTQLHLQPNDWYFKNNQNFTYMLEHVSLQQGYSYLQNIKVKFSELYFSNFEYFKQLCSLNDKYGNPVTYIYNNFTNCSPTSIRYLYFSLLILKDMKLYNLNNINIIEIGGGYGGLCFFIQKLSPLFKIKVTNYTIFDICEISLLQEKYLDALEINVECFQLDKYNNINSNSFLISTYCFSEIPIAIQNQYIEKIINPYTDYGFIAWNNIPVYNFKQNSIITKNEEIPNTGKFNYFVRFYPNPISQLTL